MPINKRYIFDVLYGKFYLPDYIWHLLRTPEIQRLREIRLCNINSLCLTGGANINRFEHAIGTFYLALKCSESWFLKQEISEKDKRIFLVAALFHDVGNAAFGHTVEYIEEIQGYNPENSFETIVLGPDFTNDYKYKNTSYESIFFGSLGTLYKTLNELGFTNNDIHEINDTIRGKSKFGPLISNKIDLDNIDNVFRLAYHIGLTTSKDTPLKLAESLWLENGKQVIKEASLKYLKEWFEVRRKLYSFLLLNPEEFSGKCMLTEAVENGKLIKKKPFKWFDTDYKLLEKIKRLSDDNENIISRLMNGDLYGCICILSTTQVEYYEKLKLKTYREKLEANLQNIVRGEGTSKLKSTILKIHPILDWNKTERAINIITDKNENITIGRSSKRLFIGVFIKNKDFNMHNINSKDSRELYYLNNIAVRFFSSILNDQAIINLPLHHESELNL